MQIMAWLARGAKAAARLAEHEGEEEEREEEEEEEEDMTWRYYIQKLADDAANDDSTFKPKDADTLAMDLYATFTGHPDAHDSWLTGHKLETIALTLSMVYAALRDAGRLPPQFTARQLLDPLEGNVMVRQHPSVAHIS
jgi:hypothetical protein